MSAGFVLLNASSAVLIFLNGYILSADINLDDRNGRMCDGGHRPVREHRRPQ